MYSLNQVNKLVSYERDPARSLPLWRGFLLIPLIVVCFAFPPQTREVIPPPDGCYNLFNTAEGCDALGLNAEGAANTGVSWRSLFSGVGASFNTGARAATLLLNNADANTAIGTAVLLLNSDGAETQRLELPRWSVTQAMPPAIDHLSAL